MRCPSARGGGSQVLPNLGSWCLSTVVQLMGCDADHFARASKAQGILHRKPIAPPMHPDVIASMSEGGTVEMGEVLSRSRPSLLAQNTRSAPAMETRVL